MNSAYDINGNKVSLREYLEFRLLAIEKRLDEVIVR
jgi:hypothetical protein